MNKRPNIVLVITDDQGYGDLGCSGNTAINTPHIDKFSKESVNFKDFHVAPLCAPTRGELMSGCCALRNGVWATCWGRSILSTEHETIAEAFRDSGYETGMFGKWHLGDNYPYRPQDRGFNRVVAHKGGGVGQTPDFWGNNYFDDTYFKNGEPTHYDGYCTDVWFDCAEKFIADNKDRPFFAYIATNAPHTPYLVDEKYAKKYRNNNQIVNPGFYGIIENIDENFGKLREKLEELKIADNTILIFMTDNGSSGCGTFDEDEHLVRGYNAKMRGQKASFYEGGHRVPFIVRWKDGNLDSYQNITDACYGVDIFPTLADICGVQYDCSIDGKSFAQTLLSHEPREKGRIQVIQYEQHTDLPYKYNVTLSKDNFRLVKGKELYDIEADPSQLNDIAQKNPELVAEMLDYYDKWWNENIESAKKYNPIFIGDKNGEKVTRLDAMDVLGDVAWNQAQVYKAVRSAGKWCVSVKESGTYKFTLKRWPIEEKEVRGCFLAPYTPLQKQLTLAPIKDAVVKIDTVTLSALWNKETESAEMEIKLKEGENEILEAGFNLEDGEYFGAYYVYIEKIS